MESIKTNLAFFLDIPGCEARSADTKWTHDYVEYSCGLTVATEMLFQSIQFIGPAFMFAHQQHHDQGHSSGWQLVQNVEINGAVATITANCSCARSEFMTHWAVADGRNRFSGVVADKLDEDVKERAPTTEGNQCPKCKAILWRPERDYKLCVICGWMQEMTRSLSATSKRGFLDHAYAGFDKTYRHVPLRVVITHAAGGKTKTTYLCPILVNGDYERRCNENMERHVHGLRGLNGKLVLNCPDRHRIILAGSTWTIFGERSS